MALDFGFGVGLDYKYDFNAKFNRQRAVAEDRRRKEETQQAYEWKELERQLQMDASHEERLARMRTMSGADPTDSRMQQAFDEYSTPYMKEIGEVTTQPGWSQDPELRKKYDQATIQMMSWPDRMQYTNSFEDYEQFLADRQKLSSKEVREYEDQWDKYQKGETDQFSYVPGQEFSIRSTVSNYLDGVTIEANEVFDAKTGVTTKSKSISKQQYAVWTNEIYNENSVELWESFKELPEATIKMFRGKPGGTAEENEDAMKAMLKTEIDTELNLKKYQKAVNASYIKNSEGSTTPQNITSFEKLYMSPAGYNNAIIQLMPISGDKIDNDMIWFGQTDGKGNYSSAFHYGVKIPKDIKLTLVPGEKQRIGEYVTFADGRKMAPVRVYVTAEEWAAISHGHFNDGMDLPSFIKDVAKFNNEDGSLDYEDPDTGEIVKQSYSSFVIYVPLQMDNLQSAKRYNNSAFDFDPYGDNTGDDNDDNDPLDIKE